MLSSRGLRTPEWARNLGPALGATTAVLLNGNARKVNDRVVRSLQGVVPAGDLFVSRDELEAARIADAVVGRRYGTVFTGGGDGTFVAWLNQILDRSERRRSPAPRFGVLALGTGNAVAGVVGARPDTHVRDLRAFLAGRARRTRRLDLLSCDGRRTPFAGLGIDAAILNDYNWLRQRLEGTAVRRLASGISGYGLAIALRSAPRQILERRPAYCEVVNLGRAAWRLDEAGEPSGPPIGPGELLYAGPCMMAAASTVPTYGFGLRAFPFATARAGAMHLRIAAQVPVSALLLNLPRVWAGRFAHPGLLDFHAERVRIGFERPAPLQIGGDAHGWREAVTLEMAPPVELVDFQADGLPN